MKKIAFLLSIFLLINISSQAQLFCFYKKPFSYPKPSFYSYRHHPEIYSSKDIATLNEINKHFDKLQKKYKCFVKHYERFANYQRLVKVGLKRYEKKMYREDRKAQKYGNKFVNIILMDYLDLDSLLSAKIIELQGQTKINDSLNYIIDGLKQDIQELTFQIGDTKSNALMAHGAEKTNMFIKAIKLNKDKTERKEEYISFLLGDNQIKNKLAQRYSSLKEQNIAQKNQQQKQQAQTQKQQGKKSGDKQTQKKQKQYSRTTYYLFRIDQLSAKISLTTQDKVWLSQYRDAQDSIQQLEDKLSKGATDSEIILNNLAKLYWNAFYALYRIYNNHINDNQSKQIHSISSISKQLHGKYLKNKDIYTLWQADHYLGAAVIKQENILADKYNIPGNYLTSDILPITSNATTLKKSKNTNKQGKKKSNKKINCIPSTTVYTYSISNPTPVRLHEIGTYYRVYVGITTRQVLPKEFADYQPITYIKLCRSSKYRQKRYYVGRFSSYQQARKVANKLYREYGIHAKVVKFINGKPAVGLPPSKPNNKVSNCSSAVTNISQTTSSIYVVRIGTYSSAKQPSELQHIKSLYYTITDDGKYAYFDGPYYSYNSAQKALSKLRAMGYNDAYIQAFNNGQHISINRAKQHKKYNKAQVIFGVQVGAYSQPLSQTNYKKIYGRLGANYQISMIKKGPMYVYYVYGGTTYKQAKQIKQKVKKLGYNDAFIIAIRNNIVVPLSEVVR